MRWLFVVGLSLSGIVGAMAGCGGSSSDAPLTSGTSTAAGDAGAGGGGSGPSVDDACAAEAKARCQRIDACTNGLGVAARYADEATCEVRQKDACVKALAAPETANTPTNVAECADDLKVTTCTDLLDGNPYGACIPPAGPREDGAACGVSAQCKSTFCAIAPGAACGTCAELPKEGDSCVDFGCPRGMFCAGIAKVCRHWAAAGAECDHVDHPCDRGLSCVGATNSTSGTCQPAAQSPGVACDPKLATGSGCDRNVGLYCDATSKTCVEAKWAKAGEPCGVTAAGEYTACLAGARCETAQGSKVGTCAAATADGAACDSIKGVDCVAPAKCVGSAVDGGVAGTCTLVDPASCH
jgi:hypothetical protein